MTLLKMVLIFNYITLQSVNAIPKSPTYFIIFFSSRTMWKKCCFSGDGEFIVAGSAKQHTLHIWEKSVGNLVKILHGTKGELLLDVTVIYAYFTVK